ncbi:MAG: ABC transporter ATP-binding protein [Candidatus Brocadiae bacterium]|nr:ABC transporter ATP-binding protein [Candidatus Brocadiia bacterium]
MIEVDSLVKRYAGVTAVDGISFKVDKGEIIGFLGKNGAGKSTTMKILSSFFPPTSGSARVAGFDCVTESMEVRRRVGYMPERVPIYEDMRVEEYLRYRAKLKGVAWRGRERAVNEAILAAGLKEVRRKLVGSLSKGYRQRAGLADAIVHKPELLILDEPTAGLDPGQIRQVRDLIKQLGTQTTLLLSTHILSEVELTASRILLIHRGRLVASGSPGSLVGGSRSNRRFLIEIRGGGVLAEAMFRGMPGVLKVDWIQGEEWQGYRLETGYETDPRVDLAHFAHDNGWDLRELREERETLEDLFVRITKTDEAGPQVTVTPEPAAPAAEPPAAPAGDPA